MRIALCPGHHEDAKGAGNAKYDLNEYDEANKLVPLIVTDLMAKGHTVSVFKGKLSEKVEQINAGGFDLAIDLHFNADNDHTDPFDHDDSRGRGCMVMYCPGVLSRKYQAQGISREISHAMGSENLGGRAGWYWGSGVEDGKPTKKDYFLEHTNCPAFILEPLYIDNNAEAERWFLSTGQDRVLANAITEGVEFYTFLAEGV